VRFKIIFIISRLKSFSWGKLAGLSNFIFEYWTHKKTIGYGSQRVILNIDEFVDLIRRVQIPCYEEARRKFAKFGVIESYSDSSEVSPYFPDILKIITEM
jgi:hypothetical protein